MVENDQDHYHALPTEIFWVTERRCLSIKTIESLFLEHHKSVKAVCHDVAERVYVSGTQLPPNL